MNSRLRAVAVAVAVAAACSGTTTTTPTSSRTPSFSSTPSDTPSPNATSTPSDSATPTSAGTDVPDEITLDYLDIVMADFSAAQSDVLTTARDAGTVNVPVVQEGYRLIASGDHADLFLGQIESFGVEGLADPMGQSQIAAVEILDSTEECVLFLADVDESSLLADPSQAFTYDGPWHIQILRAPLAGARDWPWELSFRFFLEDPAPQTCAEMDELRPGFS